MTIIFRDRGTLGRSRRASSGWISSIISSSASSNIAISCPVLPSPFGDLSCTLSVSELRETAYEVFIAACRSAAVGNAPGQASQSSGQAVAAQAGKPSLRRSMSSTASRMRKVMEKPAKKSATRAGSPIRTWRRPMTVEEVMRVQMRVSEQADSRIRKGLLRIASVQLGKRIESMILPLEFLQHLKITDFPDRHEYEAWQVRNLKVLEAGLLIHPYLPVEKSESTSQNLWQIIHGAAERPIETGRNSESMLALRRVVMSLACRSFNGSVSENCHWVDGNPLNLHLYQRLLEALLESNEEGSVVEEIDEILEMIKKTWGVLGINERLHNLCLLWVLFQHFVITGEVNTDILCVAESHLAEILRDDELTKESFYWKILESTLRSIIKWSEKKLVAYHDTFGPGNVDSMHYIISLVVSAAEALVEDTSQEYHSENRSDVTIAKNLVDNYIRSSLRAAFAQRMEKVDASRNSFETQTSSTPLLSSLAMDIINLANIEKNNFSPILKKWHPLAAGIAVATLHTCYGYELRRFMKGVSELTDDSFQVLEATDKLEKKLVLIAVEESADSEDGGKAIIQEMPPYEAQSVISNLIKSWMGACVNQLDEWIGRNLQQEVWCPRSNKDNIAPSAVEVLRILDETSDAFFRRLPTNFHHNFLPVLVAELDKSLQQYILKALSGCVRRSTYIPPLPALTRCEVGFKLWCKKERSKYVPRRKSKERTVNGRGSLGLPQLCVRINTMHHISKELENLRRKLMLLLGDSEPVQEVKFARSLAAYEDGIAQLSESVGYKVVFDDLNHVLWGGLYIGDASSSRIEPFLRELEPNLETISNLVHMKVRDMVLTAAMTAAFDGFLLVLLAGGPARMFLPEDAHVVEDDFRDLRELFLADGDGLSEELVDLASAKVKRILPLLRTATESLIEWFKWLIEETYGSSTAKVKYPLPPTTGQWSPSEPNTLLRVLCHRNDEAASRFLKKAYNFPTRL